MHTLEPRRFTALLFANGLLRVAASAGGALPGFDLVGLARCVGARSTALVGAFGLSVSVAEVVAALPSAFFRIADRRACCWCSARSWVPPRRNCSA